MVSRRVERINLGTMLLHSECSSALWLRWFFLRPVWAYYSETRERSQEVSKCCFPTRMSHISSNVQLAFQTEILRYFLANILFA